ELVRVRQAVRLARGSDDDVKCGRGRVGRGLGRRPPIFSLRPDGHLGANRICGEDRVRRASPRRPVGPCLGALRRSDREQPRGEHLASPELDDRAAERPPDRQRIPRPVRREHVERVLARRSRTIDQTRLNRRLGRRPDYSMARKPDTRPSARGVDMRSYDATPGDGYQQAIAAEGAAFLGGFDGGWGAGPPTAAATAWSVAASSRAIEVLAGNRLLFLGLFLAQLGIVFILSASVQRLAASTLIRGRA